MGTWRAAERELAALGAACSRAETWEERAPGAAWLRQEDRDALGLVGELESGVVATRYRLPAGRGVVSGHRAWEWSFHNNKEKIRSEK